MHVYITTPPHAVSIADAFLEEGEIVSIRGRNGEQFERFAARPGDVINGKPLVVLINAGTASSAEIVAGALQDQERATVRYFRPAGRSFDGTGILPDIEAPKDLPTSQEDDKALALAFKLLRETTAPHQKG